MISNELPILLNAFCLANKSQIPHYKQRKVIDATGLVHILESSYPPQQSARTYRAKPFGSIGANMIASNRLRTILAPLNPKPEVNESRHCNDGTVRSGIVFHAKHTTVAMFEWSRCGSIIAQICPVNCF